MANPDGNGLYKEFSYSAMIRDAFQPEYWNAPDGRPMMERTFALYWGLAIQAYELTLVSDSTRFDRFIEGDASALSALEQSGLQEFQGGGSQCTQCHQGAESTAASFSHVNRKNNPNNAANLKLVRTGVSPIAEDIGSGALDAFGVLPFPARAAAAVSGLFKSPGLRNVELTGPYLHNGS